jgi:hypothetical protein
MMKLDRFIIFSGTKEFAWLAALAVMIMLLMCPERSWGVDCAPHNISLNSQASVDHFQAHHGSGEICDVVTGNLTIQGADISDLSGLSSLVRIGDTLIVRNNPSLVNIGGLEGLVSVFDLIIVNNDALANIDAFSRLGPDIFSLHVRDNDNLPDINGLSGLESVEFINLDNNDSLAHIDGLSGVTTMGGSLDIDDNDALADLDGLSSLAEIGWDLIITGNASLSNLDGLSALAQVQNFMLIGRNDALVNVDGLSALAWVGGQFSISRNPSLTNLDGLSALLGVGGSVGIVANPLLSECSGIYRLLDRVDDAEPGPGPGSSGIPDVGGAVSIRDNYAGCNSLEEVLGGASVQNVPAISPSGLVLMLLGIMVAGLVYHGHVQFRPVS